MLDSRLKGTFNFSGVTADQAFIDLWLSQQRTETTQILYRQTLRDARRFWDGRALAQLTVADVEAWHSHMRQTRGLVPATCRRNVAVLSSLLKFAVKTGFLPHNVVEALHLPRLVQVPTPRYLTEQEVKQLLHTARTATGAGAARNWLLVMLLYYTGARVSEICALRGRDVRGWDVPAGKLHIVLYGKGDKERTVCIAPPLEVCLRTVLGDGPYPSLHPLLPNKLGHNLNRRSACAIVKRLGRQAGLRHDVTPHWLRHSHASHALDRQAPLQEVQRTLGHASLRTTSRYTHARPDSSSGQYLADMLSMDTAPDGTARSSGSAAAGP